MTFETRTTINLEDIRAIEYECTKCHSRSVRLLDDKHTVASGCNNCNNRWLADGSQEHEDLKTLLNVLRNFRKSSVNTHVTIRLDISGTELKR